MADNTPDFSRMTDEELDNYEHQVKQDLEKRKEVSVLAPALAAAKERGSPEPEASPYGMSGPELFFAGMGQRAMQIPRGLKELGVGAFGSPEEISAYNREKAHNKQIDAPLLNTWQGKAGGMGTDVLTAAGLLPSRLGAQMLGAAAGSMVSPIEGDIKGTEFPTRLLSGATAGVATGATGYPLQLLGKGVGAATRRYTPEGQEALRLNDAANRLGVKRNVGSLDQSSSTNAFETNLPGYSRTVEDQVKSFTQAAREVKDIPSKTGKSFESRTLEGEKLRQAIEEGGKNLEGVGSSLWKDLDSYIVQNNIAPVAATNGQVRVSSIIQNYTPIGKKGMQLDKNPAIQRISDYDPEAAQLMIQMLSNPKSAPLMPFSDLHKLSSAVGKAMGRAEKDASAPGASVIDRQMRRELKDLYGSLMSDVDSWGTKNPKAKELFDEAKTFWRDAVVPGAMTNKVYNKSSRGVYGMNPRGYSEPSQLYGDVVNNPRAMQDLYPYMPQMGRDLTDTLRTMPDVSRSLISNTPHPPAPGMGTLTTMAGMAVGSPLQLVKGALSHAPGVQRMASSDAAKRLYFSRDVLNNTPSGRLAYGAVQYPEENLEGGLNRLWNSNKR